MELKELKLKKILSGLPVKIYGQKEVVITGLSSHSKTVMPGNLFVAKSGFKSNGSDFIEEAIVGGAKVVLSDLYDPFCKNVTQVVHPNPSQVEAILAKRFYHDPSKDLHMVGITGTNGKTTTAYFLRQLMGEKKTGLIGTIEYFLGKNTLAASLTTPDVITNYRMLSIMRDNKLKNCVMEVTSHALDQNRVGGIEYDLAIFTQLTQDHLDYHKDMESYFLAKSKLFTDLSSNKKAIINIDCPYGVKLISKCNCKVITYSLKNRADYQAENIEITSEGIRFELITKHKKVSVQTPLFANFNIYNLLAAIAAAFESKVSLADCLKRIEALHVPPGRMQGIKNKLGVSIFVDFAHTDDALKNVLIELKKVPHRKMITVFGCGGDRDNSKRKKMGQVASKYSDYVVITSDNPRTEDPDAICTQVSKGCLSENKVLIEPDRQKAIKKAIELSKAQDIILIAGRGHETHQLIGHKRVPFSDAQVTEEILESLDS